MSRDDYRIRRRWLCGTATRSAAEPRIRVQLPVSPTAMTFIAGGEKPSNSGRTAGTMNVTTARIKEMTLAALEMQDGGGIQYLADQAQANPVAFLGLLGKILPAELRLQGDGLPLLIFRNYTGRPDIEIGQGSIESSIEFPSTPHLKLPDGAEVIE